MCYRLRVLTITYKDVPEQIAFVAGRKMARAVSTALVALSFLMGLLCGQVAAQDSNESLGPKDNASKGVSTPLLLEMKTLRSSVRPKLAGVHPRVYFTGAELAALSAEAHGAQKMFGWFGGYGLEGTYGYFTTGPLGLPGFLAATDQHERVDEPERARDERALAGR